MKNCTIILQDNNAIIRRRIIQHGIKVCFCARFYEACWLDYNPGVTDSVHGVGVPYEGMTQQETLTLYKHEQKNPVYCKDVDEFISKIIEAQNEQCRK